MVVSTYLLTGHGAQGPNAKRLAALQTLLSMIRIPWVVVADWNMTPQELRASGFVEATGGEVLVPEQGPALPACPGSAGYWISRW